MKAWWLRLHALVNRRAADAELGEEIRFHLDRETERLVREGLPPAEARRRALVAFGGVAATLEVHRDGWGFRWLEDAWRDARYAVRVFARNPALAATAVVTLALGIGASAAIFSAVDAVVLRPLPLRDPGRLVMLWTVNPDKGWFQQVNSPANVLDWRDGVPAFEDVAAYTDFDGTVTLTGFGEPRLVPSVSVMGNFFSVLGVDAQVGRTLVDAETWAGRPPVVVISDRFWRQTLNADPAAVGRQLTLDGRAVTIVGVMPPPFAFPNERVDLWAPLAFDPAQRTQASFRRAHWLRAVARLAPGATLESARAELDTVARRLEREYPDTNRAAGAGLTPLQPFLVRDTRGPVLVLMGAVALLLLIACANVGNLLLVQAAGRDREAALRLSLGAGRGRLIRQALAESLALSGVGGLAGLAVGWAGTRAFGALRPASLQQLGDVRMDWRVFAYLVAVTTLSGLLFGLGPAIWNGRRHPADALKNGARGGVALQAGHWSRALVVVEVAVALLLTVGAGLLVRSFLALQRVDAGFDPSSVLTVELVPRGARYDSPGKRRDFYHQLLERLEALPGVRSAAAAAELPLTNHGWTSDFSVAGRAPDQYGVEVAHREVTPGYFETMRVPVLRGREFTDADTAGATPVILINDALARRYFRGEDPLGQRMAFARAPTAESVWWTIVGIVGSERQDGLDVEPVIQVMQPFDQASGNPMTLVIRTSESPGALAAPVRALVADLDPDLPILGLRTMEEVWDASLDTPRFLLAMLATFAAVGLLLAMVGVYGVMAQFARGRRHEMGIRLALGASAGAVRRLVLGQGLRLVAVGLACGLGAAFLATRAMRAMLFAVQPADPITFGAVAALLLATGMAAVWVPAWRVSRTNPAATLRSE